MEYNGMEPNGTEGRMNDSTTVTRKEQKRAEY